MVTPDYGVRETVHSLKQAIFTMDNVICFDIRNFDDPFIVLATPWQLNYLAKSAIIMTDSTHDTNAYGLHLSSLMVLSPKNEGVPVGFCISKRATTATWSRWFNVIKEQIGIINSELFMTDMDNSYYNAWSMVMGKPKQKRVCEWHVHQAWKRNLPKITKKELRKPIWSDLMEVCRLQEKEVFLNRITELVNYLRSDADTRVFADYFDYYLRNIEEWALCYKQGVGPNTNMILENLHKQLKHVYMGHQHNLRLDKLISILKDVSDQAMGKLAHQMAKQPLRVKERPVRRRHELSLLIPDTDIKQVDRLRYYVSGYVVSQNPGGCEKIDCIRCRICGICYHIFKCECTDYISGQICKHSHKCATILNFSPKPGPPIEKELLEIRACVSPQTPKRSRDLSGDIPRTPPNKKFRRQQLFPSKR